MSLRPVFRVFITCCVFLSVASFGGEAIDSPDFKDFVAKAREKAAKYGTAQVLLVSDIDNTLLAANQALGSDQWFNWQDELIKSGKPSDQVVARDFAGLLSAQGTLFLLGRMRLPQPDAAALVRTLQEEGFSNVVLTSRGYDFRDATERELRQNGYAFERNAIGPVGGYPATYLPYDPEQPEAAGLSAAELKAFGVGRARPVSYMNGVFMGSGQHKGVMLRALLKKTERSFRSIVFIDDQKSHCDRLHQAFDPIGVDVVTIRYGREDGAVKAFQSSDKKAEVSGWKRLESTINAVLPRTASARP